MLNQFEEAIAVGEASLAELLHRFGPTADASRGSNHRAALARAYLALGDEEAARPHYTYVLEVWESDPKGFGNVNPTKVDNTIRLAERLQAAGEHDFAERTYRIAIARSEKLGGPSFERARAAFEEFLQETGRSAASRGRPTR